MPDSNRTRIGESVRLHAGYLSALTVSNFSSYLIVILGFLSYKAIRAKTPKLSIYFRNTLQLPHIYIFGGVAHLEAVTVASCS